MTKTILVIGAGPGIGLATARKFAASGFRALLASRDAAKAESLAAELRGEGLDATGVAVDAGDVAGLTRLVEGVGPDLAVLHYNVGVVRMAGIADQDAASLASDIQLDIAGALVATKAAHAIMAARGSGTILLTGGGLAHSPMPALVTLSLGKVAIRTMAQMLFAPFAEQGVHIGTVTVNAMVPPRSDVTAGIADQFFALHAQDRANWTAELNYPAA